MKTHCDTGDLQGSLINWISWDRWLNPIMAAVIIGLVLFMLQISARNKNMKVVGVQIENFHNPVVIKSYVMSQLGT